MEVKCLLFLLQISPSRRVVFDYDLEPPRLQPWTSKD